MTDQIVCVLNDATNKVKSESYWPLHTST